MFSEQNVHIKKNFIKYVRDTTANDQDLEFHVLDEWKLKMCLPEAIENIKYTVAQLKARESKDIKVELCAAISKINDEDQQAVQKLDGDDIQVLCETLLCSERIFVSVLKVCKNIANTTDGCDKLVLAGAVSLFQKIAQKTLNTEYIEDIFEIFLKISRNVDTCHYLFREGVLNCFKRVAVTLLNKAFLTNEHQLDNELRERIRNLNWQLNCLFEHSFNTIIEEYKTICPKAISENPKIFQLWVSIMANFSGNGMLCEETIKHGFLPNAKLIFNFCQDEHIVLLLHPLKNISDHCNFRKQFRKNEIFQSIYYRFPAKMIIQEAKSYSGGPLSDHIAAWIEYGLPLALNIMQEPDPSHQLVKILVETGVQTAVNSILLCVDEIYLQKMNLIDVLVPLKALIDKECSSMVDNNEN